MNASPQTSPQVGTTRQAPVTVFGLLAELSELRAENRQLRRRLVEVEKGRAKWRTEARDWKWHALGWRRTRYV